MTSRTKLWALSAGALALSLTLAGCGGGGGGTSQGPASTGAPAQATVAEPTETETAQTAAGTAAAAAKMSSEAAATSAGTAMAAVANLATLQTGETAAALTAEAHAAAAVAKAAYETAKAEAAKADAATDTTAAVEARIKAQDAAKEAAAAAELAETKSMEAVAAAAKELMIVGTMKTVGDTTVDAGASNSVVTTGSGATQTTAETGLISEPTTTGATQTGRAAVAYTPNTVPPVAYKSPMVNAMARDLKIGKVVDSADDMARLQILTHYGSTQTVRAYAMDPAGTAIGSHIAGKIRLANGADGNPGTDDDVMADLKSIGNFYLAAGGTEGELEPADQDTTNTDLEGDTIGSTTKPKELFSYLHLGADNAVGGTGGDEDTTRYAVLVSSTTADGETTYTYRDVDIYVQVDRDGDTRTEDVYVTAKLPVAKAYSHVHFGTWASLGEATKDGSQKVTELGIGFVQSIGDGLTGSDLPNNGSAIYAGNWAATVQVAQPDGNGGIYLRTGVADVTANFNKDELTAVLDGLATLKGDISGNTYSGTAASAISAANGLDPEESFTGTFSGGFYGSKAAETAGVFDFASKNNAGGAFRGAFGGDRTDNEN